MSVTGAADGPPMYVWPSIGDSGTGMHCVIGILAALMQRHHTGKGQQVEVSMQDAVLNLIRVSLRDHQRFGRTMPRNGNQLGSGVPGNTYRCAPGGPNDYIYVIVQPPGWAPIANLIGKPELADDPDWATPAARLDKLDKMFALIEQWTEQHTKFEVMDKLNALNVPCGPIMSTRELIEDETLAELGAVVEVKHPQRGSFKTVGCPLKLSDSPVQVETSPGLGEHNSVVYGSLGIDTAELEELKAAGVI